jgi:hypothetical protein
MSEGLFSDMIFSECSKIFEKIASLDESDKVALINSLRMELHRYSPFAAEPVDCVLWIKAEDVSANDYNPNSVAPPEMKLLVHSISEDGYTQPIVTWKNEEKFEVVDGWHRHRVGREVPAIREKIRGYLPITVVNDTRTDRGDRIASTIRHNRARGKHRIDAMSDIVIELKRRNWSDEKIGRDLGMDPDEVLRLTQITGLAEMFSDREFSTAWEAEESTEINDQDNLSPVEEAIHAENPPSLPKVGRLERGDVPPDKWDPMPGGNRRIVAPSEDSISAADGYEKGTEDLALLRGGEPEQPGKEPSGVDGAGGMLVGAGSAGLPYETGMARSNRGPAKASKRSSRFSDKGMGI